MAIVHDVSNSVGGLNSGVSPTSVSVSVTVGASGVAYLWIAVRWIDTGTGPGISLTSVDVDGNSPDFLATASNSGFTEVYVYRVTASGTYTVNANFTAGDTSTDIANCVVGVISVTSNTAGQDIQVGTASVATGSTSPMTVDVTGTSTNNLVLDAAGHNSVSTETVGAGQTQRFSSGVGSGTPRQEMLGSTETSVVGTVTMSWTLSINRNWATVAAEMKEIAAASARMLALLGVGS